MLAVAQLSPEGRREASDLHWHAIYMEGTIISDCPQPELGRARLLKYSPLGRRPNRVLIDGVEQWAVLTYALNELSEGANILLQRLLRSQSLNGFTRKSLREDWKAAEELIGAGLVRTELGGYLVWAHADLPAAIRAH